MNYGLTPTRTGDIIFFYLAKRQPTARSCFHARRHNSRLVFWAPTTDPFNLSRHNLRSGVLFSEERERKATRDSAVSQTLVRREKSFFFLAFPDRLLSRCYTFALLRKKRTPDRRLITTPQWFSVASCSCVVYLHVNFTEVKIYWGQVTWTWYNVHTDKVYSGWIPRWWRIEAAVWYHHLYRPGHIITKVKILAFQDYCAVIS